MARSGTHYETTGRYGLTDRQSEVLRLVARGLTNAEIAQELGITLDGAKFHVSEILGKLGVATREEAAARWRADSRPTARARRWLATLPMSAAFKLIAAAAGVAVVGAVAMLLLRADNDAPPGEPTANPTALASGPAVLGDVAATIDLGWASYSLALFDGNVWVGARSWRQIAVIEPSANKVLLPPPTDSTLLRVASGGGSLWAVAAELQGIVRLNSAGDPVATVPFERGAGAWLAYAGNALWAARPDSNEVVRIDPVINRVVGSVGTADGVAAIAAAKQGLWAIHLSGEVTLVDPATNAVVRRFNTVESPRSLAVTDESLWVTTATAAVRFDVATGRKVASIAIAEPGAIYATDEGAWVLVPAKDIVVHIDARTNSVLGSLPTGRQPIDIVGDGNAIWIANYAGTTVTRVDPHGRGSSTGTDYQSARATPVPPDFPHDFLMIKGVLYTAHITPSYGNLGRGVTADDLGPEYGRVINKVNDVLSAPGYFPKNGDAGLATAGTPVFEVKGYDPRFRVATQSYVDLSLFYEAQVVPDATTGADYFDVRGKVVSVSIQGFGNNPAPTRTVSDAATVSLLVEILLLAPVEPAFAAHQYDERRVLVLMLRDGTAVQRLYDPEAGILEPGIRLPDAFRAALPP